MRGVVPFAAIAVVAVAGFVSGQTVGDAPTDGVALKGIVLWPHQARKRPDLSAAISLEFAYDNHKITWRHYEEGVC